MWRRRPFGPPPPIADPHRTAPSSGRPTEPAPTAPPAPRRTDGVVDYCGLAWAPFWEVESRDGERLLLPAFGGA
ncbi:MAG: hypothetical protein ACK4WK_06530 [Anaerolineae bacterium]